MRDRLPVLRQHFAAAADRMFISTITEAELAFGCAKSSDPPRNERRLARLRERLTVLPFDTPSAYEYAQIRLVLERTGRKIGPNDLLIAAQARAADLVMVTGNRREFDRVPGLKVETWLV